MKDCDLLITADFIATQNETREVISKGALAISGKRIAAVGPVEIMERAYKPAARRNLGHALVLPGLVNAHTHAPMCLLRGMADDLPLMEWLTGHIFPREARLSPHMLEVGTMIGCAEMLRTGTTACADMYLNEPQIYRAMDKCGIKAMVGEGIFGFPSIGCADPSKFFDIVREQVEEIKSHPRLRPAVMPHSVYTTSREILECSAALAQELGVPLHIHLAETATETAQSMELYGCRPVEICRQAGVLGPNTFIAHAVDLNKNEIALLAEAGVSAVHCPRSNMKLASGVSPVPQMLAAGMNVALGTDGASSNNMLNMFIEMGTAALLHKVHSMDPTTLPAQTVLDMATLNGGKALSWPGLGRLSAGGPADLTALDLTAMNLAPLTSAPSHLVYAATGHEVFLTMVDGQILYDNRNYPTMDYSALVKEAQDICNWLVKQK